MDTDTKIPELEPHCGSWIVSQNGRAVLETFNRASAELAFRRGYTVQTAAQWLASLNA